MARHRECQRFVLSGKSNHLPLFGPVQRQVGDARQLSPPRTVKRHWDGILQWFDSKIANGLIEGLNSLVQAAKAKARG